MKTTFLSIFLLVSMVGCGFHFKSPSTPPATATSRQNPPRVSDCDKIKTTVNSAAASAKADNLPIQIERHFQRVVRKDCAGRVVSDKIETVKSPTYDLQLNAPSRKPYKSVFVFNETTCNRSLATMPIENWPLIGMLYPITGDGRGSTQIKADLSDALLTFKLNDGLNKIFIEYFYDCSPKSVEGNSVSVGDPTCERAKDVALVEYPVTVSYSEKTLDGKLEISPSEKECRSPQ